MNATVIICTHNPKEEFLRRTLDSLRQQTLPVSQWSLCLVDNASTDPLTQRIDLSWHPNARVVRELKLGLTNARICGFQECHSNLLIWSDDDNLLEPTYVETAVRFMEDHPRVGIAGGKSLPEFERAPPAWFDISLAPLGCRDLGNDLQIISAESSPREYPAFAPIGAGMITRRAALAPWIQAVQHDDKRRAFGRTGSALTSGEDNDMNLTGLRNGWDLAYVPRLSLVHLIPSGRLEVGYLKRISRVSFRDFVRVLDLHGIRPWPPIPQWTVRLRAAKAWWKLRAWVGPKNAVKWHAACGQIEGRSMLNS